MTKVFWYEELKPTIRNLPLKKNSVKKLISGMSSEIGCY